MQLNLRLVVHSLQFNKNFRITFLYYTHNHSAALLSSILLNKGEP